jgi:DNA-binding NarL/FixJ family response regulator
MVDPIRVLIAEDYLDLRLHLVVLLNAYEGIEIVGTAHDGQEALELCATLQPDIVLMDAQMPEMDGFTATRAIREQFPTIRVVMMTSGFIGEDKTATEAGASGFLLKPVTSERIIQVIQAVHALPGDR